MIVVINSMSFLVIGKIREIKLIISYHIWFQNGMPVMYVIPMQTTFCFCNLFAHSFDEQFNDSECMQKNFLALIKLFIEMKEIKKSQKHKTHLKNSSMNVVCKHTIAWQDIKYVIMFTHRTLINLSQDMDSTWRKWESIRVDLIYNLQVDCFNNWHQLYARAAARRKIIGKLNK